MTDVASTADIRRWAQENGHQVGDRGRIPASVLEAYEQAHRPAPKAPRGRKKAQVATVPPQPVGDQYWVAIVSRKERTFAGPFDDGEDANQRAIRESAKAGVKALVIGAP